MLADEWDAELVALHVIEDTGALQRRRDTSARRGAGPSSRSRSRTGSCENISSSGRHLTTLCEEGEPGQAIASTAVDEWSSSS